MTEEDKIFISRDELEKKVMDVCYNRVLCLSLGMDYDRITKDDLQKARDYILSMYKLDERRT